MLDVRKLGMLSALGRLGTVAAVADEFHLTAPGVSMQLASLERELRIPLTERKGRRLVLTPAGQLLAAHGAEIIDRLSLAELEADSIRRGAVGSYRMAAFPSAARTFVADIWRTFLKEGESIELSLTTPEPEGALAALSAGETDLAIVHSYSNVPRDMPSGVTSTILAVEPIRLAIRSDDPVSAEEVDLAELAARRWIAPIRPRTCFEMTARACGLAGFQPQVAVESMDFAAQLELVAAGVGVALVPHLTVASVPEGVRLARTTQPVSRTLFACIRDASRADRGLQRIIENLRAAATARVSTAA